MSAWRAEVVVDEPLVRRLLEQFDLTPGAVRPFAEGWDYAIWLVDEELAFRFPRRAIAIPGVNVEIRALPALAPHLPVPVPVPVYVGAPSDEFPWPFFGSLLLPGNELGALNIDDADRVTVARSLAVFLRALHAVEIDFELRTDSNRRADMAVRVPKTREQLSAIATLWDCPPTVSRLLDEAETLPPSARAAVVHGDLHFRQLLAKEDGKLTGVIDWVDVCRSDPAIDLSMYWSYFPPRAREAFLEQYGLVGDDQLARARVLAFSLNAALAAYGHDERNENVAREALAGLARAAS